MLIEGCMVDKPAQPFARLLLAHGAGAPMDSAFLQQLAEQLTQLGIEVWRFNFAYMAKTVAGKKQPPSKMPMLLQEMVSLIERLPDDLPLVIAGKSMGGRVATMLAADAGMLPSRVRAVVVFGYPFCPPAKQQLGFAVRTSHFDQLQRPLLIIQGDRDAFGTLAELSGAQWPLVDIQWLAGGDHDLKTLKRHGQTQAQLLAQASRGAASFMQRILTAEI
jgi:hypothetical protein